MNDLTACNQLSKPGNLYGQPGKMSANLIETEAPGDLVNLSATLIASPKGCWFPFSPLAGLLKTCG
jgi:hypothetical protein